MEDVQLVYEDFGAPEITVVIQGVQLRHVPVDGGSGVNVMIDVTA